MPTFYNTSANNPMKEEQNMPSYARDTEMFLNRFLQNVLRLQTKVLEAENKIGELIKSKSKHYSYSIGLVGAVATFYLLNYTPYIGDLNKGIERIINDIVLSDSFQALGLVKPASSGWLGFFRKDAEINPTVKIISDFLKHLNKKFINTAIPTQFSLLSLAFTSTQGMAKDFFKNYFENNICSPLEFLQDFKDLDYDAQNIIAEKFILNYLRRKTVGNFDELIKKGNLANLKLLISELKQLEKYLDHHLRIIQNRKKFPQEVHDEYMSNYECFSLVNTLISDDDSNDEYMCPLTHELMIDPVTVDGHNYERKAIVDWINRDGTSPLTRKVITINDVVPNVELKNKIVQFKLEKAQRAVEILEHFPVENPFEICQQSVQQKNISIDSLQELHNASFKQDASSSNYCAKERVPNNFPNSPTAIYKLLDAIGKEDNDSKQLDNIYITRGEVNHTISNQDNYYTSDFINLLLHAFNQGTLTIQAYPAITVDRIQDYFEQIKSSVKDYHFIPLNVAYDKEEPQHKNHWTALIIDKKHQLIFYLDPAQIQMIPAQVEALKTKLEYQNGIILNPINFQQKEQQAGWVRHCGAYLIEIFKKFRQCIQQGQCISGSILPDINIDNNSVSLQTALSAIPCGEAGDMEIIRKTHIKDACNILAVNSENSSEIQNTQFESSKRAQLNESSDNNTLPSYRT